MVVTLSYSQQGKYNRLISDDDDDDDDDDDTPLLKFQSHLNSGGKPKSRGATDPSPLLQHTRYIVSHKSRFEGRC